MSKEVWRQFEKRIVDESGLKGITAIKIPEQFVGVYGKGYPKQKKTSFDFCFGIDGLAAFADAKTMDRPYFNFKTNCTGKKVIHQYTALSSAYDNLNIAGYLFWFYTSGVYAWANIGLVRGLMSAGHNAITLDSPGLQKQQDDGAIDLRRLMNHDIDKLLRLLMRGDSNASER